MADEKLEFEIGIVGADKAADDVNDVADAANELKEKAEKAAREAEKLEREIKKAGHEALGLASAALSVASALGSRSAGMTGAVVDSAAQFAMMGAALGPGGAVVGGLAGAAVGLASVAREGREAERALRSLNLTTVATMRSLASAISDDTGDSWAGAMTEARTQVETLEERARELRETANSTMTGLLDPMTVMSARIELRRVEDQITTLRDRMSELSDTAGRAPATPDSAGGGIGTGMSAYLRLDRGLVGREANHDTPTPSRGSGRSRAEELAEVYRGWEAAEDEFYQAREDRMRSFFDAIENESAEDVAARITEELNANEEAANERIDQEREKQDYLTEVAAEGLARRREAEEAAAIARAEHEEEERDRREQSLGEVTSMVGRTTKSLFTAFGQVAAGTKSADEAFKGMLASFLEMISEYASLKAATEFADAAASFARYDYAGGAAHIGAGVAFTAVAVATGIGAGALSAAAPTAPARPEAQSSADTGSRSVTNIINYNSPIVTAGTRAELGREIDTLLGEAEAA